MLAEALKNEIVEPRALSYRRNVLGLSVILGLLLWLPNINFDGLTFFGVKVEPNTAGNRTLVLRGVALLLIYHAVFFTYYAIRDFRVWLDDACSFEGVLTHARPYFPEWQMFFWTRPKKRRSRAQLKGNVPSEWDRIPNTDGDEVTWRPRHPLDPHAMEFRYSLQTSSIKTFRERFLWFIGVDLGIPDALALILLIAWLRG